VANWWDKYSEPVASGPAASGNWWDKYAVADDAPDFGDVNSGVSSSAPDPNASFLDSAWRANKAQMGPIFAGNVKRMAAEVSDPIAGLLNGTFGKPAAEDAPELSLTVNPNGNTSLPASPLIAPDAGMALMDAARGEPLRNATLRDLQQSGLAQARAGGAELQQARTDMEVPESGLERYAKLAAISAGPTLAGMTAGIVTKSPAVGAGVSTLFAVPSAYGEARDAGHSVEDAIKYAGVVGGAEVVSERLGFDALLGKLATRLPAGKLATVFGTLEKSIPGRALTGAGVEGTTEALSQAAQNAYKIAGLGEHMTFDEFMTDMKDSFGAGAMIGGPLAGSHAAAQSLAAQNDPEARIRRLAEEVIGSAPERIQTPETQAVDAGRDAARAIFAEANISNDTGAVIPDPRAIDFSQQADLETGIAPVGVAPESMGDLDQQLAGITPQPVATEPARYALSERDQLTFDHLQKSALEADRTAGEAERRGEDGSRYRKAADSYRATADKISERSTPVATPVAPPASAPIDREALLADLAEPELIRSGSRVFYRGDVPSMRARLAEAGLSEGMRKTNEDGTDAGLYFPARMQAEVDAVLRPNAGQAPVQVDAVADSAPETAAPMEVEQSPNIGTGIETKSNRNGEYLSVSNGEGTPEVRVSHSNTGVYSRLIFDSGKRSDTVLNKNGDFVDAKEIIRNANEFTGAENVAWTGSPESRQFIVEQKALSESLSDDYYRERMQIIKDLVTGQIDLAEASKRAAELGADKQEAPVASPAGNQDRVDAGDGGLFDGPRPEQAILRSQRKQEDDYRGLHRAPSRESGSPLSDLSNTYPDDVYGKNAAQYYGHHGGGHPMDRASVRIIQSYKNEPDAPVKIYRAVPTDAGAEINAGDWVTINKDYAKEHGESQFGDGYKIIEKSVKAKDIYTNGDSIHEWGYDPEVSSVLKSKRPDAKGLEVDENIELTPEEMAAFNRQVDNRQRQPENRANDAQRLPADTGLVRRPADGTTAPERAGMVSARGNRDSQSSARQVSPAADAKPDLTGQPPKFGQWFRQSKMKDAKARPMEFHHATDADFDTFDAGKRGSSTGFAPTGLGNWFSQDAGAIKGYGSKVLSGHLRLENPKVMDSHELPDLESKADYEALAKKYKVEGYDGLYFPDSKQAVAFDSVQFKENRNSGEYSESPNIYRSQHADNQSETPQAKDAKDSKDAGKLKETSNTASEPKRLFIPEVKAAKESPEQVTTKKARPEELIEARKRRGNLRQLLDCLNA